MTTKELPIIPFLQEIKKKNPSLARRAKNSDKAAIRLFCLCCMGGDREAVKNCTATEETCALYTRRTGRNPDTRRRELTEEEKKIISDRLRKARDARK